MYQTVLVPLDGSKRAETILPHVEELARQSHAKVVFLEVLEPNAAMVTPYDMVPYIDAEALEQRKAEATTYLAGMVGEMREKGIDAKKVVEQGPIVRTILDVAERENADLIAMASHGRSGLARVFYGSVAAGVLQSADRPLLIVRAQD
ncbi:MAG: universal stress protein [Caldilineaceae bacterium]|nr:universal stress protein [Caldilineaceae bacterium]